MAENLRSPEQKEAESNSEKLKIITELLTQITDPKDLEEIAVRAQYYGKQIMEERQRKARLAKGPVSAVSVESKGRNLSTTDILKATRNLIIDESLTELINSLVFLEAKNNFLTQIRESGNLSGLKTTIYNFASALNDMGSLAIAVRNNMHRLAESITGKDDDKVSQELKNQIEEVFTVK